MARTVARPAAANVRTPQRALTASLLLALLLGGSAARATVYYVDFAGGTDKASGTSAGSAWKHAPGDSNAEAAAAEARLRPGDTVRFRGGVAYRGTIRMLAAGTAAASIRYVGDEWGSEVARVDGSDAVTAVEPCASAAECGNVDNWAKLSRVRYAAPSTSLIKFFDAQGILYQSQFPAPPDPFYSDDVASYGKFPVSAAEGVRGGELRWPEAAKRLRDHSDDAELSIWVQANQVARRKLIGLRGDSLVFVPEGINPYTDRDGRYAIVGSAALIAAPGQYAPLAPGVALAWLRGSTPTIGNGRFGIDLAGQSNLVVRGFVFEHFAGNNGAVREGVGILNNGGTAQNIVIEKNRFTRSSLFNGQGVITLRNVSGASIRDNDVEEIERGSGIRASASQRLRIDNNRFIRVGRTGIALLGVAESSISGNWIDRLAGVHGNGISLYLDNRGIKVIGNTIVNTTRPMTFHGDKSRPGPGDHDFVIARNVMIATADGAAALTSWGSNTRGVTITGNILIGPKSGIRLTPTDTGITIKDNVFTGLVVTGPTPSDWQVGDNQRIDDRGAKQLEIALARGGAVLPGNVCTGLQVAPGTAIGNSWRCP